MSPRGSKCARVSKVAAKGRQVRAHQQQVGTQETTGVEEPVATTTSATRTTARTMTTTTSRTSKPVVAACEGRSSSTGRMRQPLESGLEPRENGALVQRWPARQRRRDRITAARRNRPVDAAVNGDSPADSTASLSSPSSTGSSRRSSSPLSAASSPARSTSSTSASILSRDKPQKRKKKNDQIVGQGKGDNSARQTSEQDRIRKRKQERHCPGRTRGAKEPTTEEQSSAVGPTAPSTTCATTSSVVSSSSPFSSSVSTSSLSEKVNEQSARSSAITSPRVSHSSAVESLRNALESYDPSRIYLAHVSFLDWRDLPGRRRTGTAGCGGGERVWVVGAADHEGHHRTRLLVAGRHWRPRCLRRVNMLSQPVVYAGGGRGSLTVDLFLWWFHREFAVTAMAMHPDGAILVAESADYLPPEADCVAADGLVRLFVVPKDYLEMRIVVKELRVRLATGVLSRVYYGVSREEISGSIRETDFLDTYLKKFTLKEAFADLHRAWLSIRSETFARSWILPRDNHEDAGHTACSNNSPSLSLRIHTPADLEDDRMLLNELQNLAREVSLEVTDEELSKWIVDEESELARCVRKKELEEDYCRVKIEAEEKWADYNGEEEEDDDEPTAEETVSLLSRVLTWMEREPLDPGLLLAVRSMRDTAALMVSTD